MFKWPALNFFFLTFWSKSIEADRSTEVFCIKMFSHETASLALFKQIILLFKDVSSFLLNTAVLCLCKTRVLVSKEPVIFSEHNELFSNIKNFKWKPSSGCNCLRKALLVFYLGGKPFHGSPSSVRRGQADKMKQLGWSWIFPPGEGLYCCCKSLQLRKIKLPSALNDYFPGCALETAHELVGEQWLQICCVKLALVQKAPETRPKLEAWALYKPL